MQTTPARREDATFLFRLYASTRQDELTACGWDPPAQQAFLQMQWRAQTLSYTRHYPDALDRIILVDGQPAGRILVWHGDDCIHLVDIALLPEFRGHGYGTELIRALQQEAVETNKPVQLQVLQHNPARQLYERLGFLCMGENPPYVHMQWSAAPQTTLPR